MMRRWLARTLGTVALAAIGTVALAAHTFQAPPGWKWVTANEAKLVDTLDPPEGSWLFGTMAPGWHITTRPPVILFEPRYATTGRFSVESEIFLFPGASAAGFGLFVGGADLEGKPRYAAFLIRRDGHVAIETVHAGRATLLVNWTKAPGVLPGGEAGDPARNVLRVDGEADVVRFSVNGNVVADVPRTSAAFDGIVGLKVGGDLNLHVTNLDVTHRLALPRRSK
jgi:hypothetical protein